MILPTMPKYGGSGGIRRLPYGIEWSKHVETGRNYHLRDDVFNSKGLTGLDSDRNGLGMASCCPVAASDALVTPEPCQRPQMGCAGVVAAQADVDASADAKKIWETDAPPSLSPLPYHALRC